MIVGVVEHDPSVRQELGAALRLRGHETRMAHTGDEAMRSLGAGSCVDVLTIAIRLPDSDGRDVCQALRASGQHAPVLFLSALDSTPDRLAAFGAGGDDYVAKPFEQSELMARLEALSHRGRPVPAPVAGLELDPARHSVRGTGGEALLSPTEFKLLAAILARPGEVVRRGAIIAAGWPHGALVADNTVDSFVRRVRNKLEAVSSPLEIQTVRGVGLRARRAPNVSAGDDSPAPSPGRARPRAGQPAPSPALAQV